MVNRALSTCVENGWTQSTSNVGRAAILWRVFRVCEGQIQALDWTTTMPYHHLIHPPPAPEAAPENSGPGCPRTGRRARLGCVIRAGGIPHCELTPVAPVPVVIHPCMPWRDGSFYAAHNRPPACTCVNYPHLDGAPSSFASRVRLVSLAKHWLPLTSERQMRFLTSTAEVIGTWGSSIWRALFVVSETRS
jgi:hypothetical protein